MITGRPRGPALPPVPRRERPPPHDAVWRRALALAVAAAADLPRAGHELRLARPQLHHALEVRDAVPEAVLGRGRAVEGAAERREEEVVNLRSIDK